MNSITSYSQGSSPSTLLALGILCLALGQAGMVASMLKWLLSFQNIMTLVGLSCLALTASSSINRWGCSQTADTLSGLRMLLLLKHPCAIHNSLSAWSIIKSAP